MAGEYMIKHRDEFESMEGSGEATWMLARKALGTSAFGFDQPHDPQPLRRPGHRDADRRSPER